MVKLGKVYSNLMVDVQLTNAKLRKRAVRIVQEATGLGHEKAANLVEESNNEVKVAVVMGLLGCTAKTARAKLQVSKGMIRSAVGD